MGTNLVCVSRPTFFGPPQKLGEGTKSGAHFCVCSGQPHFFGIGPASRGICVVKLNYNPKVSVFYIKSSANVIADARSRGVTPEWLKYRGIVNDVNIKKIDKILLNPIKFWKEALSLLVQL